MVPFPEEKLLNLPHRPGVYRMRDTEGKILYIGKAKDLAKRVSQYFRNGRTGAKEQHLVPLIRTVDYILCASERESLILEQKLIRRHRPPFNILWKDDKSYPYVQLTISEDYPRLTLTRRVPQKRDGSLYFGPYPKAGSIQSLLRYLWKKKFFPLRSCRWDFSEKKPPDSGKIHACLYYHTRECPAPCAGRISKKRYRRIAQKARWFFEGRFGRLKKTFGKEMRKLSANLEYEEAAQLRDNLQALEHMGERVRMHEISKISVLQKMQPAQALSELQRLLELPKVPLHVEAFDISNLSGAQPAGSMVCFRDGNPHKNHYRRFRIRSVQGMDDFKMMQEVVLRRYRSLLEKQEEFPDLVIIDGGKGQLSAALKALRELPIPAPKQASIVALAKKHEEIYLPQKTDPVRIPSDSPALHLLQKVRDEAHRFAVTYHKLLRKKHLFGEKLPK